MNKENIRLLMAAAAGTISGVILGMFVWGREEKKGKLSKHLSSLSDIIRELEELDSKEADELKGKISSILGGIEDLIDRKDG